MIMQVCVTCKTLLTMVAVLCLLDLMYGITFLTVCMYVYACTLHVCMDDASSLLLLVPVDEMTHYALCSFGSTYTEEALG